MQWFRKYFLRQSSIVLTYDFLSSDLGDFRSQVDEVSKFFVFGTVSSLIPNGKTTFGRAALVFLNPRKAWLLYVYPWLREREIPFTVMLNPECVGLNRLPLVEEFHLYGEFFGKSNPDFEALCWKNPREAQHLLAELRKKHGPLPFDKIDPLRFFTTWGELAQIPPLLVEWGFHFESTPEWVSKESLRFIEHRVGQAIIVGYSAKSLAPNKVKELGLTAVVGTERGELKSNTAPFMIPVWEL